MRFALAMSAAVLLCASAQVQAETSNRSSFSLAITARVEYHPHISSTSLTRDGRTAIVLEAVDQYNVAVQGGRALPMRTNKPWTSTRIIADRNTEIVTITLTPR